MVFKMFENTVVEILMQLHCQGLQHECAHHIIPNGRSLNLGLQSLPYFLKFELPPNIFQ